MTRQMWWSLLCCAVTMAWITSCLNSVAALPLPGSRLPRPTRSKSAAARGRRRSSSSPASSSVTFTAASSQVSGVAFTSAVLVARKEAFLANRVVLAFLAAEERPWIRKESSPVAQATPLSMPLNNTSCSCVKSATSTSWCLRREPVAARLASDAPSPAPAALSADAARATRRCSACRAQGLWVPSSPLSASLPRPAELHSSSSSSKEAKPPRAASCSA
mmetsp:Transcript_98833/g.247781  ORF Transcript_98833/g.247781 Transcript_98833/m.247781 type:complete len:219 (-) Transcript_98833:229-885(-)